MKSSISTSNAKKRAGSEDFEDGRHNSKKIITASDPSRSAKSTTLHEKFYFPDSAGGLSVFKVDWTYYKVHRFMLERESQVFKAMFSSPSPPEGQDGESDEKPIEIPDVSCSEFEALVDFLYNGAFSCLELLIDSSTNISISPALTAKKQKTKSSTEMIENIWRKITDNRLPIFDLISISLRFEFERITKVAVGVVDLLDRHCSDPTGWSFTDGDLQAIKRINMAFRHDVLRHWLLPAYQSLVLRNAPLTADEIKRLGYHRMAIVAAEREKRLHMGHRISSVPPGFLINI